MPEERIKPLSVIATYNDKSSFRGALAPLISGEPSIELEEDEIGTSRMPAVSGKRSRRVKLNLGIQILEGFLEGFGMSGCGISAKLEGVAEESFSFQNVVRRFIDIGWLGRMLTGRIVNKENPAAAIFFNEANCDFIVILL